MRCIRGTPCTVQWLGTQPSVKAPTHMRQGKQGDQEFNGIFSSTEFQTSSGYMGPCLQRMQQERQDWRKGGEEKWRGGDRREERKEERMAGEENKVLHVPT